MNNHDRESESSIDPSQDNNVTSSKLVEIKHLM